MGLPEFYNVSLPACHGLRTPPDLHHLAIRAGEGDPSHVRDLPVGGIVHRQQHHIMALPEAAQGALQPGRYLVANGGLLISRVEYLKPANEPGGRQFAVVDAAMKSGKRSICAGPGNPPVVVDANADLELAGREIVRGAIAVIARQNAHQAPASETQKPGSALRARP